MARPEKLSAGEKADAEPTARFLSLAQKALYDGSHKPLNREAEDMQRMAAGVPGLSINELPISNPCEEKQAADKGNQAYQDMLHRLTGSLLLLYRPEVLEERTREVYRRCFMKKPTDMGVLNDYAAHHPLLALSSPWLADLLDPKKPKQFQFRERDRSRALKALAKGFARASNTNAWKKRAKRGDVDAAWRTCKQLREELTKFYGPGSADIKALSDEGQEGQERARGLINAKLAEIAAGVPNVQLPNAKIAALILAGQLYDAAKIIASRIWNVRERDIEQQPEWQAITEEILHSRRGKASPPAD